MRAGSCSLQDALINSMTCPMCLQPPFFNKKFVQCSAGHTICKSCYERLDGAKVCPTCCCSLHTTSQCLVLESLIESVPIHCCPFPSCNFVTAQGMVALRDHTLNDDRHVCRGQFAIEEIQTGSGMRNVTNISGIGCVTFPMFRYEGEIRDGYRSGRGKLYLNNGNVLMYQGDWMNGLPNGQGRAYNSIGSIRYEGQWVNGKCHGIGRLYQSSGFCYVDGYFYEGDMDGAMIVRRRSDGAVLRCETYVMGIEMINSPYTREIDMPVE